MKKQLLFFVFFVFTFQCFATTWDEPWQEEIYKNADSFVKLRILSCDEEKGFEAEVLENIAGKQLPGKIKVSGFFLLRLTSMSAGHGPEFHFKPGREIFFFLKESTTNSGEYQMSTPTSGFAPFFKDDNIVHATYLHSYHQAIVPADIYVQTTKALFNFLHDQLYDKEYMNNFMATQLKQKPAIIGDTKLFFLQHVALEVFYFMGDASYRDDLFLFLDYKKSPPTQTSAVRALSRINTLEVKQKLVEFLEKEKNGIAQVMAVWALERMDARELAPDLQKIAEHASEEETWFGRDIMDPRVGTYFPSSVKKAIEILLKQWDKK